MKEKYTGFRYRNADFILANEEALFKRLGMEKVGFEGVEPKFFTGGAVWYVAKFPGQEYLYTISFESWWGTIRQTSERIINPKLASS